MSYTIRISPRLPKQSPIVATASVRGRWCHFVMAIRCLWLAIRGDR